MKKETAEFTDLRLVQCLSAYEGPVWTMKFSPKGEYLATGGQNGVVTVWLIEEPADGGNGTETSASPEVVDEVVGDANVWRLIKPEPYRRFTDHTADVIDLSWNRENFLLSASIDKSVRLWHVARPGCLHVFAHLDVVTSVDFHPKQGHFFLSGCFDKKLRIWNVTDGRVSEWTNTPEMVTAACFNPEGTVAVAGLYRGQVN